MVRATPVSTSLVRGCAGKTTGSSSPLSPSTIRPSRGSTTFASRWIVATTYVPASKPEPLEHVRAFPRDRREREAGVGHHVADDRDRARYAFGLEDAARALVRAEQQVGDRVHLDARVLLRHRHVAGAHPRLDVGERHAGSPCCTRARERRVRIAEDDGRVRALPPERVQYPGLHRGDVARVRLEPVGGLGQPELLEEHVRQLAVVVLSRVEDDLLDAGLAERDRQRPRLDELRAVADDGEHLHGVIVPKRENPHGQRVPVAHSAVLLTAC